MVAVAYERWFDTKIWSIIALSYAHINLRGCEINSWKKFRPERGGDTVMTSAIPVKCSNNWSWAIKPTGSCPLWEFVIYTRIILRSSKIWNFIYPLQCILHQRKVMSGFSWNTLKCYCPLSLQHWSLDTPRRSYCICQPRTTYKWIAETSSGSAKWQGVR